MENAMGRTNRAYSSPGKINLFRRYKHYTLTATFFQILIVVREKFHNSAEIILYIQKTAIKPSATIIEQ